MIISTIPSIFNKQNVYASSGALKKNNIKLCPNGKYYGYHSSNKHWHEAQENENISSGWIAIGEAFYYDPCPTNNNNSNNNNSNNSEVIKIEPKSNETGISDLIINNEHILTITDIINYTVSTLNAKLEIKLKDNKANYDIQGETNNLSKDKINEIKIIVTAEDGTQKTYKLNITREIIETNVRLYSLKVCDNTVEIGNTNKLKVSVLNSNAKLIIKKISLFYHKKGYSQKYLYIYKFYKSKLFLFNKNSCIPIMTIPSSFLHNLISSLTTIIFLKLSPILFNGLVS